MSGFTVNASGSVKHNKHFTTSIHCSAVKYSSTVLYKIYNKTALQKKTKNRGFVHVEESTVYSTQGHVIVRGTDLDHT